MYATGIGKYLTGKASISHEQSVFWQKILLLSSRGIVCYFEVLQNFGCDPNSVKSCQAR